MTGAASAQKATPVAAPVASAHPATVANVPPAATPVAKPQTKVTPSILVVVTNSRSLALTELDATAELYHRQLSPISPLAKGFL
jgi:hypothetical protein